MKTNKKSGKITLLMSVLMSTPGPLVVGIGLLMGKSSTQLADFFRRTAELLAIIVSFVIYLKTNKNGKTDAIKKKTLENFSNTFMGCVMCICAAMMITLAFFGESEKGNVIPGLVIALLGVVANTIFWIRYTKLSKSQSNSILAVQARLYGAKSLVDGCVTIVLATLTFFPTSAVSFYLDFIGSIIVALYLLWCGIRTLVERFSKKNRLTLQELKTQLQTIKSLVKDDCTIEVKEDGFLSRGFVVDDGRLVFKFPRNKNVTYQTEIANLNFLQNLKLNVNLQKVAFAKEDNSYLAVYGVPGNSLEEISLDENTTKNVGAQLGLFLKKLHTAKCEAPSVCTLQDEISAWQKRVQDIDKFIKKKFSEEEKNVIDKLMFDYMPKKLKQLGEKLVFSHGDLGDGNVFIAPDGSVGVIDFNESGLLDQAADFMDIDSENLCQQMLSSYGADSVLREKVELRRDIRPLIVLKPYLSRADKQTITSLTEKIRKTIKKYQPLI